jgi:uncharacterized protein YjiS (DUF1127 family)
MTSERISLELVDLSPPSLILALGRRLVAAVARWRTRARQRAALAQFSPRMLRDIGLSEADVQRDPQLPTWMR